VRCTAPSRTATTYDRHTLFSSKDFLNNACLCDVHTTGGGFGFGVAGIIFPGFLIVCDFIVIEVFPDDSNSPFASVESRVEERRNSIMVPRNREAFTVVTTTPTTLPLSFPFVFSTRSSL
jgi:hypothetical protein